MLNEAELRAAIVRETRRRVLAGVLGPCPCCSELPELYVGHKGVFYFCFPCAYPCAPRYIPETTWPEALVLWNQAAQHKAE